MNNNKNLTKTKNNNKNLTKNKNNKFSTKNILEISIDLSNPKEFEKNVLELKKKLQFLKDNKNE
tara:strand:- start:175 stop:366 length:192 start_codon:yes stop_codon:yes gene_type:complete